MGLHRLWLVGTDGGDGRIFGEAAISGDGRPEFVSVVPAILFFFLFLKGSVDPVAIRRRAVVLVQLDRVQVDRGPSLPLENKCDIIG